MISVELLVLTSDTADRVVFQLLLLAGLGWSAWNGVKTWRGEESRVVAEYERTKGPWPHDWGPRRRYRSISGSAFLAVPISIGFGLVVATDLVRMLVGQGRDWGPLWVASYIGVSFIIVSGFALLTYLLVGLPDPLRPPCQRGWKEVKGRLVLVRPGRTPQERAERQPITVDPAYRPRAEQHRQPPHTR